MNGLVAACKKEGQLNVITLPANWANYGTIMKDFTAKYGIKINDANPDGSSQDEINAMQQLKGQSRAPDVLDMGTAFAIKADQEGLLAPYKVATLERHPGQLQGLRLHLVRRLRRLRGHRLRLGQGEGPADLVQGSAQADLQEPGRHQRQPDPGQCRVLRGVRLRPGQRRLAEQHRAGHPVLQEAAPGRQLRAGHGRPDHCAERPDPDRDLVGLPAGLGDVAASSRASRS